MVGDRRARAEAGGVWPAGRAVGLSFCCRRGVVGGALTASFFIRSASPTGSNRQVLKRRATYNRRQPSRCPSWTVHSHPRRRRRRRGRDRAAPAAASSNAPCWRAPPAWGRPRPPPRRRRHTPTRARGDGGRHPPLSSAAHGRCAAAARPSAYAARPVAAVPPAHAAAAARGRAHVATPPPCPHGRVGLASVAAAASSRPWSVPAATATGGFSLPRPRGWRRRCARTNKLGNPRRSRRSAVPHVLSVGYTCISHTHFRRAARSNP